MAKKKKEPIITKEPLLGFLVTKGKRDDGTEFIWLYNISVNWEGLIGDAESDAPFAGKSRSEILGILPAPPESYKVFGCYDNDETLEELGCEFKGTFHPNWKKLFMENKDDR